MKYTAIVVDDEHKVRNVFIKLLAQYCNSIEVVGIAENIHEAYKLVIQKDPQIVFLDIEMPNGNGFELLSQFNKPPFEVVFVTSHGSYALRALKVCALDYLLKPVLVSDLLDMEKKIKERIAEKTDKEQYKILLENISGPLHERRLVVHTKAMTEYVLLREIMYLEGDGNYTTIHSQNESFYVAKTLKDYEEMLCGSDSVFMRAHKSCIVNLRYVNTVFGDQDTIRLKNNKMLEVSRRRKQELIERLALHQ